MGVPACQEHEHCADEYYKEQFGCDPNADTYLYCEKHCDLWRAGCPRCEECCQHHYGCTVKEKFGDANTPEERGVKILKAETGAEVEK